MKWKKEEDGWQVTEKLRKANICRLFFSGKFFKICILFEEIFLGLKFKIFIIFFPCFFMIFFLKATTVSIDVIK